MSHSSYNKIDLSVADTDELIEVGNIMAEVYSQLEGFPSYDEQPGYYRQFSELDILTEKNTTDVIIAKNHTNNILGGVVYFSDMENYGAGGKTITTIQNAAGIRLLAVTSEAQGQGIGRKLTEHCIERAKKSGKSKVILHTTSFMPIAWALYERMGFQRNTKLDFKQGDLEVFGFHMLLQP